MATLRRYFTKKISSKDIDKNLEGKYSASDDLPRQGSVPSVDGVAGETGERRRMRSVSISRSGRFKQKKRERGALQDRPDLYQNPSKQDTAADEPAPVEGKQDNPTATCKQTTIPGNNNVVRRVPTETEGVDLYKNQSKQDLVNESSTDDGLRENTTATHKQTTSSNSKNNNSISKMVRPGYKGAESSGRLTTQATMV